MVYDAVIVGGGLAGLSCAVALAETGVKPRVAALWRALRFDEEDVDALDALSAYDFLRAKGVSRRIMDRFWRFESMTLMNVPLERCSAAALLRVHGWLMRYRGLHFGFPAAG